MTILNELRRRKDTIKNGVINMVHRVRGNGQEADETEVQQNPPGPERRTSPVMSTWDSSEDEQDSGGTKSSQTKIIQHVDTAQSIIRENESSLLQNQKHQEPDRRRCTKIAVERKRSFDLGPTESLILDKGKTCSSESEHTQTKENPVSGKTGKKHSSKPGHQVKADMPARTVEQERETYGDTLVVDRGQKNPNSTRPPEEEKEHHLDIYAKSQKSEINPSGSQRPKRNSRRPEQPKTPPLKPVRAAGFVSRKQVGDPQNSCYPVNKDGLPSDADVDELLQYLETTRYEMTGRGTSRNGNDIEDFVEFGGNGASLCNMMECYVSEETNTLFQKRGNYFRLNVVRGESAQSARTISPQVGSDIDPLEGLDDLLSEMERIETQREKDKPAACRMAQSCFCRSDSGLSWSSASHLADENDSEADGCVQEPGDRPRKQRGNRKEKAGKRLRKQTEGRKEESGEMLRKQRADRKMELKVMNQLLEELVCPGP